MRMPRVGKFGVAVIGFCVGIGVAYLGPHAFSKLLGAGSSDRSEEMRVTSPNGKFDAVMIREGYGGGAGGFDWCVFIVPTGKSAPDDSHAVFRAGELRGEKLVWNQPHLLEIHYDLAEIEEFRNLWGLYEVQNVGSTGARDYDVEMRLVPAFPDYSLLTPSGAFRRK